jgi:hypothetical protein
MIHTGKEGWVAEARRYKVPICTESLRLSCPAPECIEKKMIWFLLILNANQNKEVITLQ